MLDGDELNVLSVALGGREVSLADCARPDRLTISKVPDAFTLTTVTQLDPAANTKLMGLYRSGSAYCTQCEAEGFRRITYFLDRPDVLAVYTTRIEADEHRGAAAARQRQPGRRGRHRRDVAPLR